MTVLRFPATLHVEHDTEAATVSLFASVGEHVAHIEQVALRPEHNNPIDAIRAITQDGWRDDHGYQLEYPEDRP